MDFRFLMRLPASGINSERPREARGMEWPYDQLRIFHQAATLNPFMRVSKPVAENLFYLRGKGFFPVHCGKRLFVKERTEGSRNLTLAGPVHTAQMSQASSWSPRRQAVLKTPGSVQCLLAVRSLWG